MFWSVGIFSVSALSAATIPTPTVRRCVGPLMASTSPPDQLLCVPTPPEPTGDSHPGPILRGSQLPILRFAGAPASQVLLRTAPPLGFASAGHTRRAKR